MENESNLIYRKAYDFAVHVVKTYQYLTGDKKEFVLSKQLVRCGTSIGANVAEALGGISKADFSAKMSIAYKESLETKYWLDLLKDTGFLNNEDYANLHKDADELGRILFSIVKTSRQLTMFNDQ